MDDKVEAVLARYHDSMRRRVPLVPGSRAEPLLAVGPEPASCCTSWCAP